jgi:hypothetical protein
MKMARFQLLVITLLLILISSGCKKEEWESLFNDEDLEGWTVKCLPADQGKEYWTVTDGYIQCNSMGDKGHNYVWLISDREFADFHLRLKFQVFSESGGNSGVQFRSRYDDSDSATYGGWLNGPQVDIHGPDPYRTGLIYDETDGVRRWIYPSLPDWNITPEQAPRSALETSLVYFEDSPEAWNDMEIICRGMMVETRVNGNSVTEFNGEGILNDEVHKLRKSGQIGSIAFQLHMNDELKIRFKDILIKE